MKGKTTMKTRPPAPKENTAKWFVYYSLEQMSDEGKRIGSEYGETELDFWNYAVGTAIFWKENDTPDYGLELRALINKPVKSWVQWFGR